MESAAVQSRSRRALGRAALGLFAAAAVLASLVGGVPSPATAAPGQDDEGGSVTLQRRLDAAASGYNNAHAKAQLSARKRTALAGQLAGTEKRIAVLDAEVQQLGAAAYRGGLPDTKMALTNSRSLADLMGDVALLDSLSYHRQATLDNLRAARRDLDAAKREIDRQLVAQRVAERTMAKRRADAEEALTASNVGGEPTKGFTASGEDAEEPAAAGGGEKAPAATQPQARAPRAAAQKTRTKRTSKRTSRRASPAKRRSDGTWPSEGCTIGDPTSNGCLTPRTLHAFQQARAVGFTHYVHCWREASFGEHPKGRACDFAAAPDGFGAVATGSDRAYGNRLAAWFIDNADRLGVLYVIWFRQIWLPGIGWRSYQSSDDPAASHRNHVHLSVQ